MEPSTSSSTSNTSENVDMICTLSNNEKLTNVTAKGNETLRKTSIERNDII